jgi:hypothetical protein
MSVCDDLKEPGGLPVNVLLTYPVIIPEIDPGLDTTRILQPLPPPIFRPIV